MLNAGGEPGGQIMKQVDRFGAGLVEIVEEQQQGTARGIGGILVTVHQVPGSLALLPLSARLERGPRDSKGRSLRDFDLHERLFRYPLSYMIYSESFDAMPSRLKKTV